MSHGSENRIKPRNGHTLQVGVIARISGCADQNEMSLEDQIDHHKVFIAEMYDGPVEYFIVATVGKGESLTREELEMIEAELRKRKLDILIMEDLGRLVRGTEAVRLLGIGVDHGTRVIAPGDNVDTANDAWEAAAIKASADHVAHNAHTSRRIKTRNMNRFLKFGGCPGRPIAGYIVPDDAKTYGEWIKDPRYDRDSNPEADLWIYDGLKMLKETLNCTAVADMFNARGIPVGPYCRKDQWDGVMVWNFYNNPLLKGFAQRGKMHSAKHFETGHRKSVKNPKGPLFFACPQLAYFAPIEIDPVLQAVREKNARYKRGDKNGVDARHGVPRRRTKFPGQHADCWYCGHSSVWGGNGVSANLMCDNSRHWHCWNSFGFNGQLAARRVMEAITTTLYKLPELDEQFRELVERAAKHNPTEIARRWEQLSQAEAAWEKEKINVTNSMRKHGEEMFAAEMDSLKAEKRRIAEERNALQQLGERELKHPDSLSVLREMLEKEFVGATWDSAEFSNKLRKLCPEFHVYLVRLCDGGHPLPRARIRLAFAGMLDDAVHVPGLSDMLSCVMTIDLFEPVQRERIREEAVKLAATGLHPRQIAPLIAEQPTFTAVQNALDLHNKMLELGLSSPYILLQQPPEDYAKLRRHKNAKYEFRPRNGYEPPALPDC
jgi:site-specific DNA recombinase